MSIADEILDRSVRKMLYPLWPKRRGDTLYRAMMLSEEMFVALTAKRADPNEESRFEILRADLELFSTSQRIDGKYLFHLYPAEDAVWEIRSVREDPSIRVLGFFADYDVFIAMTYVLREALGGWQSREWKMMKRRALAQWRALFAAYDPRHGTDPRQHMSGVIDGKFFRDRA
jgi:hypothetical protein